MSALKKKGEEISELNSRQKGKRGELELSKILREYGFDARRGQQYCGANGDADVVGVPGIHIECKRVEKLNIEKAVIQAWGDSKTGELAVVMHRKNQGEWLATMTLDQWVELYKKGQNNE